MKRKIIKVERGRLAHTPAGGGYCILFLECGHKKSVKASQEPKKYAFCRDCRLENKC